MSRTKISIIGAGAVGSTTAYALTLAGLASELVIVDINKDKAEGEAMDIADGGAFVKPVEVRSGDYEDTKDSNIVVITAGAAQQPGETRLDLVGKNYRIFSSIIPQVTKYSPNAILLVVSNPADVLAYITYKLSGFPKERVIGSGTVLDTSRLRTELADHFGIDARNVHTYIMGEHGDSEVATWSITNIAGMSLQEYCDAHCQTCEDTLKEEIHHRVVRAAYEIINRKGATFYAIGVAVKRIVEAILRDENSILTVSAMLEGEYGVEDIYLGVPCIVGSTGVKQILNIPLAQDELELFQSSAKTLKTVLENAEKDFNAGK